MAALEAAGCPYEFVPGVSSALAAPLLAGLLDCEPHTLSWKSTAGFHLFFLVVFFEYISASCSPIRAPSPMGLSTSQDYKGKAFSHDGGYSAR